MRTKCPHCEHVIADTHGLGPRYRLRCPSCQKVFVIEDLDGGVKRAMGIVTCVLFAAFAIALGYAWYVFEGRDLAIQRKATRQAAQPAARATWPGSTPSRGAGDNSSMAYIMMQRYVRQRLKAPSSAKFPGVFDGSSDHTVPIGNDTYSVTSWVDAKNAFGVQTRVCFTGKIRQESEDRWKLLDLTLDQ